MRLHLLNVVRVGALLEPWREGRQLLQVWRVRPPRRLRADLQRLSLGPPSLCLLCLLCLLRPLRLLRLQPLLQAAQLQGFACRGVHHLHSMASMCRLPRTHGAAAHGCEPSTQGRPKCATWQSKSARQVRQGGKVVDAILLAAARAAVCSIWGCPVVSERSMQRAHLPKHGRIPFKTVALRLPGQHVPCSSTDCRAQEKQAAHSGLCA